MTARPSAEIEISGSRWVLFDAGRSPSGLGLGYFAERTRSGWAGSDEDRRAVLEPGEDVASLEEGRLRELWESATPLTPTERRFVDDEGDLWLAQGVGPVWTHRGTAEAAVGTRVRCLSSVATVVTIAGRAPADLSGEELAGLVRVRASEAGEPH
jgi:hypothetical protein